ncbi:helix-turn-helix domain-containing protein [Alkalibaculum sp. M08DMB]|uniref:Helix-turn-helix domain-containing protein n=1 Tax=Alkalibaculum sporogenes TaxID=2655001 RepID=A0A6A7K964_9FIRM|nr:helix-turn-helix transcriptional regulator [Alkalibaculum sporogenes]MPW25980.1 helix-turn-helix domain-containing protein [Alkalibaculum sporogenes]
MDNKIKVYRAINKISQEDLSRLTGLSRPNISNIERGDQVPNGNTMLKIAKALNASVEDIFLGLNVIHEHQK